MVKCEKQTTVSKTELFSSNEVIRCFDHFKKRYKERFSNPQNMTFNLYYDWVKILKGNFVYFDSYDRMVRLIGNYHKIDDEMYKIIYVKSKRFNIYVPLTIYKLNHKSAFRLYLKILKNEKNEKNYF